MEDQPAPGPEQLLGARCWLETWAGGARTQEAQEDRDSSRDSPGTGARTLEARVAWGRDQPLSSTASQELRVTWSWLWACGVGG